MRPKEFISRCLDLVDFSNSEGFTPQSLNSASLCLSLMDDADKTIETNGYRIEVDARNCLGHIVMLAEMFEGDTFIVGGSLCFTFQEYDFNLGLLSDGDHDEDGSEDHLYESWKLADDHQRAMDRVMEALTFLSLKTNYLIRKKID